MPTRHFLAYLTANERPYYVADFLNFRHMARRHPGVDRITVYVAVSRVRPAHPGDNAALQGLSELAQSCSWLDVRAVYWKGNVGRDFSSAEVCLRAIGREAGPDDYVMVRNRSAYGPFERDWFKAYVDQYERFPATGLVGSTISLAGHPRRPIDGHTTHVQTYAYLSQWRHFEPLVAAFPAARCVDRLELINEGEIGLSRRMLEGGLGLSCLNWPNEQFTPSRPRPGHLPATDVKRFARGVPLQYRRRGYFSSPSDLRAQLSWIVRLAHQRLSRPAPSSTGRFEQVTLDSYD